MADHTWRPGARSSAYLEVTRSLKKMALHPKAKMYDQTAHSSPDETQLSECSTLTSPMESEMTITPQWEFKHFEAARQRPRLAVLQPSYSTDQSSQSPAEAPQSRTERRKEQNRVSQRKFRERKEERLRKAGDEVAELQEMVTSLQRRVVELETVNLQLRGTLSSIGSLCDANPNSNPLFAEQLGLLQDNHEPEFEQQLIPFQTAFEDLDFQACEYQSKQQPGHL